MKNQTKREMERELLLKLRDAVNSREEFDWVESELARLGALEAPTAPRRQRVERTMDAVQSEGAAGGCGCAQHGRRCKVERQVIDTASNAFAFLQTIDLQVNGLWQGWVIRRVVPCNRDFGLLFHKSAELMNHARSERGMCLKLCESLGIGGLDSLTIANSCSTTTEDETASAKPTDNQLPSRAKPSTEVKR